VSVLTKADKAFAGSHLYLLNYDHYLFKQTEYTRMLGLILCVSMMLYTTRKISRSSFSAFHQDSDIWALKCALMGTKVCTYAPSESCLFFLFI
jgi:hypothetical protein